jgi:GAF domain-containing protein/HAMP domain-containing protein
MVIICVLLDERILAPAREILLPHEYDAQLAGAISTRLSIKFQFIIISIIIIVVLIVAPLGFKMAYTILYEEVGSKQAFEQLQWMLLIGTMVAIALGSGISYLLARSVSQPIRYLVDVFEKAEQGDLSQRAAVVTTDETGALAIRFNRMISRFEILQRDLESEVTSRTAQLEATSEIGRVASSTLDPDELASQIVNLITNKFGHYYAALFLTDNTNSWAELAEATGEAGKLLKERRHRLPLPGKSMVSYAILNREPRVAQNVVDESARYENPFLADTRSEIALPLTVGDRVLGALDVQSKKPDAFSADDIKTFQNMANQVAVAIENARLFKSTQDLLEEMRTASQQYIPLSWSDLSRAGGTAQYETKAPIMSESDLFKTEAPIIMRDQVMGHIVIEGENEWTSAQQNLLEAIAAQTSFALENARLLSESQQTALRERLASAIVERIWSSQSVEGILQTTIRELGRALETSDAIIELKVEE